MSFEKEAFDHNDDNRGGVPWSSKAMEAEAMTPAAADHRPLFPSHENPPPTYGTWDDDGGNEATPQDNARYPDSGIQLPPIEPDDLARAVRSGPDRKVPTFADRPRRVAVCQSVAGDLSIQLMRRPEAGMEVPPQQLLSRQDSGQPPMFALVLVKYYDVHDRLGAFDAHEGSHIGDLRLSLEPGSQFADLCVSSRYQTLYLVDQTNSRLYAVDMSGRLRLTLAKRLKAPQAVCVDDQRSLLFVCERKKVRIFQVAQPGGKQRQKLRILRSLKSSGFRNLASAAARDGRLWLADSQADRLFVYAVEDATQDLVRAIELPNPLSVSLDASGCAFVASGEPLHRVTVYGPEGTEVGSFGGWGTKACRMKLPVGVCAYQLSQLVDKRMVVVSCFAEHHFRMYSLKNLDTSVI